MKHLKPKIYRGPQDSTEMTTIDIVHGGPKQVRSSTLLIRVPRSANAAGPQDIQTSGSSTTTIMSMPPCSTTLLLHALPRILVLTPKREMIVMFLG